MDVTPKKKLKSYLDYYETYIAPKLQEIDIVFKTKTASVTVEKSAELLGITPKEASEIIEARNIKKIDKAAFFEIMERGGSEICTLFRNEVACGMPFSYHMEDVSFIYGLDIESVIFAFKKFRSIEVSSCELNEIFSVIPLKNALRLFY